MYPVELNEGHLPGAVWRSTCSFPAGWCVGGMAARPSLNPAARSSAPV